jgi:6-pyruvoyl-tetrahydropterin synthase
MTISGWPIVEADVTIKFGATHSLPAIGVGEVHYHLWEVTAGWRHEINPHQGCTKPMQDMQKDLEALLAPLRDKNLSTVFSPWPATAETLACYVMAKLPAYWTYVQVCAYGNYRVRVEANTMRRLWTETYEKLP